MSDRTSQPRTIPAIVRAAHAVLEPVRLELTLMRAEYEGSERDLRTAGRSADAQTDLAERAHRLKSEYEGGRRIVEVLAKLARGDVPT